MSLLHSFYCWGCVLVILGSTAFFTFVGISHWRILACLWALIPLGNFLYFTHVPIAPLVEEGKAMPLSVLLRSRLFWLLALLMVCAGASELSMSQWASAFAESGLSVSKAAGDLAGPCVFALLMGLSRVIYARISQRVELTRNELRILQMLLEHKGQTVSREALMTRLWESDSFVDENTLTVNVARLRRKLEAAGLPNLIRTRKGEGYLAEG